MPTTKTGAIIRWLIRRDMPTVLEIEKACFPQPWGHDDFLDALKLRNCIGMVAEQNEQVVGFVLYTLHKTCLHVINFAVSPSAARQGVGSALVGHLVGKLAKHRRTEISLEVRESNLAAQLFFRSQGFLAVGILPDWYELSPEDAYRMRYRLGEKISLKGMGGRLTGVGR